MRVTRLLAQIIDLFVCLAALVFSFGVLLPILLSVTANTAVAAVVVLLTSLLLAAVVQLPFLRVNQTIGKGFFGLQMESTNPDRPITPSIIFQREIFCKLFSCYLLCLPVLLGLPGAHEKATETRVVKKTRQYTHKTVVKKENV